MSKFEAPRWLQEELTRHLGAARTPDGLWERIQAASQPRSAPALHWTRWAVAAVLTLASGYGTFLLPNPQWRSTAMAMAASSTDARADHPADWDVRCVLPARLASLQVSKLAEQRGHPFTLAFSRQDDDCQACHSTGTSQHHL